MQSADVEDPLETLHWSALGQVSGARGLSGSRCCDGECLGTISLRCLKFGGRPPRAKTPWYRIRLARGLGTSARRAMNAIGSITTCVVPSRKACVYAESPWRPFLRFVSEHVSTGFRLAGQRRNLCVHRTKTPRKSDISMGRDGGGTRAVRDPVCLRCAPPGKSARPDLTRFSLWCHRHRKTDRWR